MKKTNKISNTSKKAIRYVAFATGLMAAALPSKSKADLVNFNADLNVLGLAGAKVGANVGNGIHAYAGANALGIGGSTGVSVADGSLVDVNADANVGPLAGAKVGASVGNGISGYVGAHALGVSGSTGASICSSGTSTAYAYPQYDNRYFTTTPSQPVSYASAVVGQPKVQYVGNVEPVRYVAPTQPATYTTTVQPTYTTTAQPVQYVTNPDVTYQSIRPQVSTSWRPAPVVVSTTGNAGDIMTTRNAGIVTVKESVKMSSYETANTEFSQKVWQRSEDNPVRGFRSSEYQRETIKRTRWTTFGY